MNRRLILAVFLAACAAQWIAASWNIVERELVLRLGEVYRFKAAPVDPVDAFRGRYVAVRVEESAAPFEGPWDGDRERWVFAEVAAGEDGFARFVRLHDRCPADKSVVRTRITSFNEPERKAALQLPLDRFYLNERIAPEAERAYREHSRPGSQDAWLAVRVWRGRAAIENLYLGDVPLADTIRRPAVP